MEWLASLLHSLLATLQDVFPILAESVPGRSPLLDGFGLIAFASLLPIISVMAYTQISEYRVKRDARDKE